MSKPKIIIHGKTEKIVLTILGTIVALALVGFNYMTLHNKVIDQFQEKESAALQKTELPQWMQAQKIDAIKIYQGTIACNSSLLEKTNFDHCSEQTSHDSCEVAVVFAKGAQLSAPCEVVRQKGADVVASMLIANKQGMIAFQGRDHLHKMSEKEFQEAVKKLVMGKGVKNIIAWKAAAEQ